MDGVPGMGSLSLSHSSDCFFKKVVKFSFRVIGSVSSGNRSGKGSVVPSPEGDSSQ